ncbi:endo-1,3-beta-glucanase Engl1 [Aspergillus avenaceus]|uniref:Glucan endo-1,3-beta-D-glucosidase 1 n=1 Tax=Aspergillus avenaceus TaxID=36643 RepID=A0A5N6THQ6_ASPAV|nr:endo-1,3-beta-glucanase Engl1 [Aspergillus avenaceus]
MANSQDVFLPVATGPIPPAITSRNDHPVPRTFIANYTGPIETNKFYAGLFLGNQDNATFTHPYSIAWAKGNGNARSWGMAVSHIESDKLALGPQNNKIPGQPISYYVNPIGIQSIILSAAELKGSTVLRTENPLPFSANAVLQPENGSSSRITFPVVQGMAFVTGVYSSLQPLIQTSVFFTEVAAAGSPGPGIFKYVAKLADGSTWLLYLAPDDKKDPKPKLVSSTDLLGPPGWSGTIQVTKNPAGVSGHKLFDNASGVYAVQGSVKGVVSERTGIYQLEWAKAGVEASSRPLMMYALPHHAESFDDETKGRMVNISLRTTTKGNATAVVGETWKMVEPDLPTDMGFNPWSVTAGSVNKLSQSAQEVINKVAPVELKGSVNNESDLNSMYFSGKALSKFATLVYTVDKLGGNPDLAAPTLKDLKAAFARFIENRQQFPLVYDNVWKGVVSSASYNGGDSGADFGNTYYNDHHFHYGYFIHAAAIIGSLDPSWIQGNKDYINMLVRDAGNAASNDPLFPFSRGFDWYHGHSWAKGLFASFDGKDEESTSEDAMFAYSLKMWGKVIGDASMEARGNLMLGILRRSLRNYFLLESNNKNHPPTFVPNKVTGILFENKVDHTTYFGPNLEFIHGIHMLPLLPASSYVRSQKFMKEEWEALFAPNAAAPAQNVQSGWKGVLYANLALIDPVAAWEFFSQPNFSSSWIDGGASRTWYLALAAGLGGA